MIRDTFFSMPRFVNLCRKEMVESWRANLLRFVMMYGIMAIAFVWSGYFKYDHPEYLLNSSDKSDPVWMFTLITFVWAIVIMGILSASFTMERMKSKTNRTAMLMTPATMFEKFFSRWLVFTFGFLIVFLIAFKLADWTRVAIYLMSYPELKDIIAPAPFSHLVGEGQTVFDNCKSFIAGVVAYFFTQSLFVLGSSIWPKNAFVKTFSAIVVIGIVYFAIGAALTKAFFTGNGFIEPIFSDDTLMILMTITFLTLACFNWVLAYFRFKESEIINRW